MHIFGKTSQENLEGVHPAVVRVSHKALELSKQDFSITDGVRSEDEQKRLFERGFSKTMNSKHRKQRDGYGWAVDAVPYINGRVRWEWPAIFVVAAAFQEAAVLCETPIRWGGFWGNLTEATQTPEELHLGYVNRKLAQGKKPFGDGPHYELIGG